MKILTFGYKDKTMAELEALAQAHNALVVDVRFMPYGRGDFVLNKLAYTLGGSYTWLKGFGNVNYKGGPIVIHDFAGALAVLKRKLPGFDALILLCVCADYNICHRKQIAERLEKELDCPLMHVVNNAQATKDRNLSKAIDDDQNQLTLF